jgi:hypothetical protein
LLQQDRGQLTLQARKRGHTVGRSRAAGSAVLAAAATAYRQHDRHHASQRQERDPHMPSAYGKRFIPGKFAEFAFALLTSDFYIRHLRSAFRHQIHRNVATDTN